MEFNFRLLVLQIKLPLVFSLRQYLQVVGRLQGRATTCFSSFCLVLIDARTKWSERFLFRQRPNTVSDSNSGLEVLVLPRISQLAVIICDYLLYLSKSPRLSFTLCTHTRFPQ